MRIKRVLFILMACVITILTVGAIPSGGMMGRSKGLSPDLGTSTYRTGPEIWISNTTVPECIRSSLVTAFNPTHQEYLVSWNNTWPSSPMDIYARRVSKKGELLSQFCITTGTVNRFSPDLAYNATNDEYLVVWMQLDNSTGHYEIWGKRIPWNGPGSYSDFLIYTWANRTFWYPRVAWNSQQNEYLVIWNAEDTTTSLANDVAGCRVSAAGVVQPGAPILITTTDHPKDADLVYNAKLDGYMVVWAREDPVSSFDVYGAFLNHDGAMINPPGEFSIWASSADDRYPYVTTDGQNDYMVVWMTNAYWPGDYSIYGQAYRADGSYVTTAFALANTTYNELGPRVAADEPTGRYLVVWDESSGSGFTLMARLSSSSGTVTDPIAITSPNTLAVWNPAVANDETGFFIPYEKALGATYNHIFGRMWWPAAIYLPLARR